MARKELGHPTGDHMSFYKVFRAWQAELQKEDGGKAASAWCKAHFLVERSLFDAALIRGHLRNICNHKYKYMHLTSCNPSLTCADNCAPIQKAILAGFYTNLGTFISPLAMHFSFSTFFYSFLFSSLLFQVTLLDQLVF